MNLENIVELVNWASFVGTQSWLVQLLYFFLTQIFLQLVVLEKKYIVKIMDKVIENLTWGRWISIDSVKSWNYFWNVGHQISGMGYIESNTSNPAYLVGSYFSKLGWSYSTMRLMCSGFIFGLKKLLLRSILQTKKKKQTTNKKEEKIKTNLILRLT